MRDPLDELENFSTPGLAMNPLPASEVRRRGTRMRRRNNALAAIGGVAAVAIIATPLAMAATSDRTDTTPPPATRSPSPTATWVQEIPSDLDLTVDMGDAQTTVTTTRDPVADENICGVGWYFSPQPTDQLSASMENEGSEGGHDRHLVVFEDADQAQAAMQQFEAAPTSCDGVYSDEGNAYEMFPAEAGASSADESSAWVQGLHDETGLTGEGYVTVAQRVGNAILLDKAVSMGVGDESVRQDGVDNFVERDQQVVDAMTDVFSDPR